MDEEKELYITALHVKNIRNLKELDVEFNRKFNFITGPNASGKTSILRCLSMCVTASDLHDSRYGEDSEVWTDFTKGKQQFRVGLGSGWIKKSIHYRRVEGYSFPIPEQMEGRQSIGITQFNDLAPEYAPLFIGAFRRLMYQEIHGMAREAHITNRRAYYRDIAPQSLNGTETPNVKQWLINRYFMIDKDWATIEKHNWQWLMRHFSSISPERTRLQFTEIGKDMEPVFEINGNLCYLEELSAGFQSILSIIFSIFDWIEGTNEGESKKVDSAVGTVIIDELDVHLHPEWQLTIRDSLERLFPRLQFIITTHSPHLIASAKPGEILTLTNDPYDKSYIKPTERSYSGWNTDQILEELMDVRSLENKSYSVMIRRGLELAKENRIDQFEAFIKDFEQIAHPQDSVLMAFKIKLAELALIAGNQYDQA